MGEEMTAEQSGAAGRLADWTNDPQAAFLPEANAARLDTHSLRSRGAQRTNPTDFTVSLRARSGTDRQLHRPGERIQAMRGFEVSIR